MTMNERAERLVLAMFDDAEALRIRRHPGAVDVLDCGVEVRGGLAAGLLLARVCLGDLGTVTLVPSTIAEWPGPAVQVVTDDPVRACLAAQYAGRQVTLGKFFGMGSGPMRALIGGEAIFDDIPGRETGTVAVGVIESKKLPPADVLEMLLAKAPGVERFHLLVAPASSLAGGVQVVARSVETALHKLHELKFDVMQVLSGTGTAPLPPTTPNELAAIGRTNDAILYGGRVTLTVDCDDDAIDAVGPKVPSSASADHGELFAELFQKYGDFYKIDPLLFSPAEVTFANARTGKCRTFGRVEPKLLAKSFYGA